jgi:hypothetical protein
MRDPRSEPTIADFRVGDLAFFLLLRITGVSFEQMLPEDVKAKVKEEGVYAYFRYTEVPANRAALQRRWKAWLKAQASQPKAKTTPARIAIIAEKGVNHNGKRFVLFYDGSVRGLDAKQFDKLKSRSFIDAGNS